MSEYIANMWQKVFESLRDYLVDGGSRKFICETTILIMGT